MAKPSDLESPMFSEEAIGRSYFWTMMFHRKAFTSGRGVPSWSPKITYLGFYYLLVDASIPVITP